MIRMIFFATAVSMGTCARAQTECFELVENAAGRISEDIRFLSSDELKGRKPGTEGLKKAAEYIAEKFEEYQIPSFAGTEYFQSFEIAEETEFPASENYFVYENDSLSIPGAYFPLKYSSSAEVSGKTVFAGYGISAPELKYDDYKEEKDLEGKILVMDISSPDGIHPHSEYLKYHDLGQRVELAKEKGAKAVLFVNLEGSASDPRYGFTNVLDKGIPVLFIQDTEVARTLKAGSKVQFRTSLREIKAETRNIIGYIDNQAEETAIIGAHYDHLGMGGKSSLYRGEKPEIHNGADDNASGTAGLLEIARNLASHRQSFSRYNYLFIAFSAEEMGLLGSSYFVKNSNLDMSKVAYMLNMDMIGRMEDGELAVNGVGTSPVWDSIMKDLRCQDLRIKTSPGGVGPSDHTSFYYKDIPVLHFFTGTHTDYHKPTDDFEKINIEGEVKVIQYILNLMQNLEAFEDIPFTATKEDKEEGAVPRFTVTLGVLPDYMFSGTGMKIDGVTEGRPADKAGLEAGDIIVKLGDMKVEDMMSYMKALSAFKKGDTITVEYKRGDKLQETQLTF